MRVQIATMQSNNFSPHSSHGGRSSHHSSESTNPTLYSPLETRNNQKHHGSNVYTSVYAMQHADARYNTPYTSFNNDGANALIGTFANYDPFGQLTFATQGQSGPQHVKAQSNGLPLAAGVFSTDIDPSSLDYLSRYILVEADSQAAIAVVEAKLKKVGSALLFHPIAFYEHRNHLLFFPQSRLSSLSYGLSCSGATLWLLQHFNMSVTQSFVNFQCVPILLCIFIAFEIAIPSSTTSHRIPCFTSLTLFAVRYFPEEREHVQVW